MRNTNKDGKPTSLKSADAGFSVVEVMTTLGMIAIIIGLAIPSYQDAIERRQITQAAELIVAFVTTIQSESIKRNRMVTVAYSAGEDGHWCVGATLGNTSCDCMETDPAEAAWCGLDGTPWALRDGDIQTDNLIQSVAGDGAYVFDPVRGLFADSTDVMTLGLGAGGGQYQLSLSVIATGKVAVCVPAASQEVHGFHSCPLGP